MTYAIVNTKDNYLGLNGKRLKVTEQHDNFIACEFFTQGQMGWADFGKSEVVKIWTPINISEVVGR